MGERLAAGDSCEAIAVFKTRDDDSPGSVSGPGNAGERLAGERECRGEASSQEGENYSVPLCVFSMPFRDVNLHIEHYSANPNLTQCISTCA